LDNGAVTFIQSVRHDGAVYASQELERYTRVGEEERNPHIAASEVAALMQLLYVPSDEKKFVMATELIDRARSEYARGDAQRAYQHMQLALLAKPDLPEAIADLPLVALRAGHIRAAISAADRAIQTLTSPAALAASWFNKGLICERPEARDVYGIDEAHCESDTVELFVKAWKVQASPARANKLRALIQKSPVSCSNAEARRYYRVAPKELHRALRIYVLHRAGEKIDVSQIRWPVAKSNESVAGAEVIDTVSLGEDAVTLLEVPVRRDGGSAQNIRILIEGRECTPRL
jgi:hypothetical protein